MLLGVRYPVWFFTSCIFVSFLTAQGSKSVEENKYQDRQRAINLTLRRADIKNLEDAPMRCFVRTQVVRFLFLKKVESHFDVADEFALDCLEDIQKNPDQFSQMQKAYWESNLLTLLRANSPATAAIATKKYSLESSSNASELLEIESSADLSAVTNRIVGRVLRGEIPPDIYPVYVKLQQKTPLLANKILGALLTFYESTPDLSSRTNSLTFFSGHFLESSIPTEIRRRFLRFSVHLGQGQLSALQITPLLEVSHSILRETLPAIKLDIPELFESAKSVFVVLDVRVAAANRDKEEALARIEEATDKLQQTMAEAETAKNPSLRDSFWLQAAQLAVTSKRFKVASDCIIKFATESKEGSAARDSFLLNVVLPPTISAKDIDSAEYAVSLISDPYEKVSGLLVIAKSHVDSGKASLAAEALDNALKILEKNPATATTVRLISTAVPVSMKIEKFRGFDLGRLGVAMVNRLPTAGPDDKIGSSSRVKFVDTVLIPATFSTTANFNVLAKADVNFASSIAQEIQSKAFALAAEIVIETERIYPMPKEPTGTNPTSANMDRPTRPQ